MLDTDFLERLVNGSSCRLEIGKGVPQPREGFPHLSEFAFRCRSHERLELPEPVTGSVTEVLLAQHAMRAVLYDRKRVVGIGLLLRKPAGRLPKRRPRFGTRSGKCAGRKRGFSELFGFLALAAHFCSCF